MRYIPKGTEPESFTAWKDMGQNNTDWTPTYDNIPKDEKKTSYNHFVEQGYICGYCECRISQDNSHIEHVVPQHLMTVDPLDYGNMIGSCRKMPRKGIPRQCGSLKDDWYDENLFVSPLEEACENTFKYRYDGQIEPKIGNDSTAITRIEKLGLNQSHLIDQRKKVIEAFLDENLSQEETSSLVESHRNRQKKGPCN